MVPLNLHKKLDEPAVRSVLTARAEGGNKATYSSSGGVSTFTNIKGVTGPLFTPFLRELQGPSAERRHRPDANDVGYPAPCSSKFPFIVYKRLVRVRGASGHPALYIYPSFSFFSS